MYQTLLPKWQCKLGAPCCEIFEQLFERACTVEQQYDRKYAESVASHEGGKTTNPKQCYIKMWH